MTMFKFGALPVGLLLCLLVFIPGSRSYRFYAERIPNGEHVPHPCKPNYVWHGVGHLNALGGGSRNQFGKDFQASGHNWTVALCQKDSDGDGLTNGQELGDPGCVWTPGHLPNRTTSITHPGVCNPWSDPKCRDINTWVSCDADTLQCEALNDPDVKNVTLRFPPTPVPNKETSYFCMTFDLPGDDTYHLVATEPHIDNANVMHHLLVYGCEGDVPTLSKPTKCGMEAGESGCQNLIGLWQVGVPGSCMANNTGYLFGKGEFTRIMMEFHWNNPELRADYVDSSGLRFFYTTKLRPNSAATMMVGQTYLEIPPLQPSVKLMGSCSANCTASIVSQPIYVIEAFNHMHYLGKSQKVELFRNNTRVAILTNDEVYSYDAAVSYWHDPPVEILPGDEIRTTCEFSSSYKQTTTYYGEATSDEMCYSFLIVYPREGLSKTKICVGYKDYSACGVDLYQGCDMSYFLNVNVPEMAQFMWDVSVSCQAFGPCTPECARVMEPMKEEPCLRGDPLGAMKYFMLKGEETLVFLSQLLSCRSTEPCPQCPCGAKNRTHDSDDSGDDDTSDTSEQTDGRGGSCDRSRFLNASVPEMAELMRDVSSECQPFGPCDPGCRRLLDPLKEEPCMKGLGFQQLRHDMMDTLDNMQLLARLIACRPAGPCPECRQCPDNDDNDNDNDDDGDNDDDTGGATAPAPGLLIGVAALLMCVFSSSTEIPAE